MSNLFVQGDARINGTLSVQALDYPAGSITDADVNALADISATKLEHQHRILYSQPTGSAVAAETRAVYLNRAAASATLVAVQAALCGVIPSGDKTVTVDVKKDGTTVLTSTVTLNSSNVLYTAVSAALAVTAIATGEVLEVVVTVAGSTGDAPEGLLVSLTVQEDAA